MGFNARGSCAAESFHGRLVVPIGQVDTFDLSDLGFVTPVVIAGIAAGVEASRRAGMRVRVIRPTDDNIANYLARVRLPSVLDQLGAEHQFPTVREHANGGLLELKRFTNRDEMQELAAHVHGAASQTHHAEIAVDLYRCIGEAGSNVGDHSGAQSGFMIAQEIQSRLRFAVADSGVGFQRTLSNQGASSDLEALELAVSGISGTPDTNRGIGLPTMARTLNRAGGALHLISGMGRLTLSSTSTVPGIYLTSVQGAIIEGVIPLNRQ
jgi:hypothetical protein